MSNNKSRSSRPYDPNNSFVKKVASRVSGLIPRSTSWLSGWFSPTTGTEQGSNNGGEAINTEEEHFEDALEKPPPSKRLKVTGSQQYVESYQRRQAADEDESIKRVPNNFIDTSAIPGPSGLGNRSSGFVASTPAVTSVEHLEPKANGDDCSESGESTSGCSSLEPQINRVLPNAQTQSRQNDSLSPRKRLLEDKLNYSYLQNSRSLYLDRTSNSRNNQTVGRRNNPSFCVSTFGTPLFNERGSVNDLILNSPFYTGRTTYGGASSASYRRSLGSASLSSSPANSEKLARHTIKVKPGNPSTEDSGMSQTAKRILATLEQFSTPILDAKRIPVAQEPILATLGSRKRTRADDTQLVLEQPRVPKRTSNKPMHWAKGAPTTAQLTIAAAPDTLILRRREIVPEVPSTATSTSTSSADTYKLRTENDNSNSSTRNTLKMKPCINDRKEPKEPEMATEVKLPDVPLPISTLPKFDISVPAPKPNVVKPPNQFSSNPSAGTNASGKLQSISKPQMSVSSNSAMPSFKICSEAVSSDTSFSFSSPIRVSSASKDQPLAPVNNFTFSKPLPASLNFSSPTAYSVKARPKASSDSPKQNDGIFGGLKLASELKTGSVMDILSKGVNDASPKSTLSSNGGLSLMDKFKPAAGTWECDKCLIRNKSDLSKCAACTNPRDSKTQPASNETSEKKTSSFTDVPKAESGFGAQFKMAQGMWECSMCMVRNKDTDTKCVSCTAAKPGSAPSKPTTPAASLSGWGDKFKPPSNTWECSVCMVRNGAELSACQSCTTKKPGSEPASNPPIKSSWGDQFKKPEGSWTCNDCMVSNKAADVQCVACSAKKPGSESSATTSKEAPKFSFGIPAAGEGGSTAPAFSFGIPKDNKETSEKSSVTSSTGFKFGETKSEVPAATFSFGVPSSSTVSASAAPAAPASQPSIFLASPVVSTPNTTASTKTVFEVKATDASGSQSSSTAESPKPTFSFGAPASTDAKSSPAPMFAFSKPTASPIASQPTSSTGSPLGSKRKFGDDTPSSSAVPVKFGITSSPTDAPAKSLLSNTSSVSSTSGPVFPFSSAPSATSTTASSFLSATVTSTANGKNTTEVAPTSTANTFFSSPVPSLSSSSSISKPAPTFGMGLGAKDESVSSTWKPSNQASSETAKGALDSNGDTGVTKPGFFGSNVSSSGMAFGSNTSLSTATFSFGASTDKTSAPSKPSVTFGSTNNATSLFGSGSANAAAPSLSFGSGASSGFGSLSSTSTTPSFSAATSSSLSFSAPSAPALSGSFQVPSEEKKTGFSFGASAENKKTGFAFSAPDEKKTNFSFGATSGEAKKTTFSFSAANTATEQNSFPAPTPSSIFQFGAQTNGPAKPNFAFGANQTPSFSGFNAQPSAAPAPAPAATPAAAPAFTFGAAPPSFGVTNSSTAQAPSPFSGGNSSGFNSSTAFSPSFGGFNAQPSAGFSAAGAQGFGSQNQTPSAMPFPFNGTPATNPPTFNFSSGTSFTASAQDSSGAGAQPRRIKKATRRNIR